MKSNMSTTKYVNTLKDFNDILFDESIRRSKYI